MEIKSAIKRPKPKDAAADDKHVKPAATLMRCTHCNRRFATISTEGGLNPFVPHEQACASCEPFSSLYEILQSKGQEHTALLDRGPKHHGRILAHEQFRKARVALENLLVSIEAPNDASFDVACTDSANRTEPASLERAQELVEVPKQRDDRPSLDDSSPSVNHVSPTSASPMIKRKLERNSGAPDLKCKRIKFCEDAEERIEYRGTLEYYRGAKEYVPGRYAVSEGSEYEDTSGSTISFAKFTGQKKLGSMFVDIVSKEQAWDGQEGTSAAKKRGKGSGKNHLGSDDKPDTPEKDESQMNSRDLRLSRRARSTTPPATTRTRKILAQYDGQENKCPQGPKDAPSLVVALEVPTLSETHGLTDVDKSASLSEETRGISRVSCEAGLSKAAPEAAEPAFINQVVFNIQRELRSLQQITVAPKCMDMVSKAVRGCYEALKPLKHINCIQPCQSDEVESPREEEDSVYFEASDGTGEPTSTDVPELRPHDPLNADEVVPRWSEATIHGEDLDESDVTLALDANTLDDMPKKDEQNLSGASEPERIDNDNGASVDPPGLSIEIVEEKAKHNKTERATKVKSQSESRVGYTTRPPVTQPNTSETVDTTSRRRSGRISSTALLSDFDKASARSSTRSPRKPRAAPPRSSPAVVLSDITDPKEFEHHGMSADNSNVHNADHTHTLELDRDENAIKGPQSEYEAVPSSCPGFRAADVGASPHDSHTTYQDPVNALKATLSAFSTQPRRCEAAESVHVGVGELINGRDDRQDAHRQSESRVHGEAPLLINIQQDLDLAPFGEAGQESEVDITDTNRHGAEKEAQVDPDTAHNSAQVTTTNDRDFSADRKDENIIEASGAELQHAVGSSEESAKLIR